MFTNCFALKIYIYEPSLDILHIEFQIVVMGVVFTGNSHISGVTLDIIGYIQDVQAIKEIIHPLFQIHVEKSDKLI